MFISEGSQNQKNREILDFDAPLKWTYFVKNDQPQQKHINFCKFYEHFSPKIENIKIRPLFGHFFSFSLLSYIEIYIEYRETSLEGHGRPLAWSKNCDYFTLLINKLDRHFGFSKKVFF